ncbi:hypothetical protein J6590_022425 [Homalodisca vitripennis]|nr:hypothetical protein J6590_022425 [Homalodisca vitripennis]
MPEPPVGQRLKYKAMSICGTAACQCHYDRGQLLPALDICSGPHSTRPVPNMDPTIGNQLPMTNNVWFTQGYFIRSDSQRQSSPLG